MSASSFILCVVNNSWGYLPEMRDELTLSDADTIEYRMKVTRNMDICTFVRPCHSSFHVIDIRLSSPSHQIPFWCNSMNSLVPLNPRQNKFNLPEICIYTVAGGWPFTTWSTVQVSGQPPQITLMLDSHIIFDGQVNLSNDLNFSTKYGITLGRSQLNGSLIRSVLFKRVFKVNRQWLSKAPW